MVQGRQILHMPIKITIQRMKTKKVIIKMVS